MFIAKPSAWTGSNFFWQLLTCLYWLFGWSCFTYQAFVLVIKQPLRLQSSLTLDRICATRTWVPRSVKVRQLCTKCISEGLENYEECQDLWLYSLNLKKNIISLLSLAYLSLPALWAQVHKVNDSNWMSKDCVLKKSLVFHLVSPTVLGSGSISARTKLIVNKKRKGRFSGLGEALRVSNGWRYWLISWTVSVGSCFFAPWEQ